MTDLRAVDRADVYLDDDLVGKLTRDGHDAVAFDYLTDTVDRGRARSVSWSLLRSGHFPVTSAGGAVPAFFAGLLPEGVR